MRLALKITDFIIRIVGYFLIAFILASPPVSNFLVYSSALLVLTVPIVLTYMGITNLLKYFIRKYKLRS